MTPEHLRLATHTHTHTRGVGWGGKYQCRAHCPWLWVYLSRVQTTKDSPLDFSSVQCTSINHHFPISLKRLSGLQWNEIKDWVCPGVLSPKLSLLLHAVRMITGYRINTLCWARWAGLSLGPLTLLVWQSLRETILLLILKIQGTWVMNWCHSKHTYSQYTEVGFFCIPRKTQFLFISAYQ